jgi:alpha-mannosidase
MFDRLLVILENDPAYAMFHSDGHTLLIHDYLEIRPENRARVEALVRQERLIIGPFYMLGDDFLQSGESHIP